MKELDALVPEFEKVMAERDESLSRAGALERDLSQAGAQLQQLQAGVQRAQEVRKLLFFLTQSES
jgi:hypothetical protein